MRITSVLLFLLFTSYLLIGQSTSGVLESMALKDFKPSNKNIWWLKDMTGHVGYAHPIRIVLATDNKVFKGAYEMLQSGEKFNLEGSFEGDEIVLIETDSLDRVTGYIKGDMFDDRFYAKWSDPKNFSTLPIFVTSQKRNEVCGNLGWAKYYVNESVFLDSMVSLVVMKNEDKHDIIINYKNSTIYGALESEDENGNQLRYVPEAFSGNEEMIIDIKNNLVKFLRSKIKKPLTLVKKKEVILNCRSLLNFDHNISYTFPIIGEKKFDDYVATEIVNKYMEFSSDVFKPHDDLSISERAQHQEVGNFKFNYLNDTLLSGVFFFQSSKHSQILELPFNYIFKAKKEYKFNEGFVEKYDFTKDVLSYLNEMKAKPKSFMDFAPEKYNMFLLDKNGVKCKTPFDIINGDDAVTIPYAYFTSKLKKKSFYK
jgi:hypothetical protein